MRLLASIAKNGVELLAAAAGWNLGIFPASLIDKLDQLLDRWVIRLGTSYRLILLSLLVLFSSPFKLSTAMRSIATHTTD